MPSWVKHALWILVALIVLANFREIGGWLAGIASSIGDNLRGPVFGFHDPVYRFAVFGVLVVAFVAIVSLLCSSRRSSDD